MNNEELLRRALSFDAGPPVMINGYILPEDFQDTTSRYIVKPRGKIIQRYWVLINDDGCIFDKSKEDFVEEVLPSDREEKFILNTGFGHPHYAFEALKRWKQKEIARLLSLGYQRLETYE